MTNTTEGGEGGHGLIYNMTYDECKRYIQENFDIKSKIEWYEKINTLPDFIPREPRNSYLIRGWVSWGDFLGTGKIQDNVKAQKYISYEDARKYIKNLNIGTILQWKNAVKNRIIPDNTPNRPERFYKKRGWISWGDFLGTGRIANQNKKNFFLSYDDACKFVRLNNIKSKNQFIKFNIPQNIPTNPQQYYKEWTTWGDFLGTGKRQDNLLSKNYLSYEDAKNYVKDNLSDIKSEKRWKEYVKMGRIPNTIPNHPELFYNRKNRGWKGWKDFLYKKINI